MTKFCCPTCHNANIVEYKTNCHVCPTCGRAFKWVGDDVEPERPEFVCSLQDLRDLKDFWARRLHLESWDIELRISTREEIEDEDSDGKSYIQPTLSCALIVILDPEDYRKANGPFPQDMEVTLVHELLHIAWIMSEPLDMDATQGRVWHRDLENTAKLLVSFRREASN